MNEEKNSSEERELNQSSSSSAADMRDWDMLDLDISVNKKDSTPNESNEIQSPSGLFIHEPIHHSGVEEVSADRDDLHHSESNSSSDIDIIDECIDTDDNHSNISVPLMDISFCSSDIGSTMSVSEVVPQSSEVTGENNEEQLKDEAQSRPAAPTNAENSYFKYFIEILRVVVHGVVDYYREGMPVKELFIIGFVATICLALSCIQLTLLRTSLHEAKMEQMEGHVNKLITENEHLKSKVLAKIEGGKLFGELDEGVRDLKSENYKLHKAMQTVIHQLEEQTNAIKKGIDVKGDVVKDPYRKEITKLKEQINLLRIDNEELQKQLVRIRYGRQPENHDSKESKPTPSMDHEQNKDQQQEIQELRKKLDEEVAKLKNWKDSIEDFVKEIEKPHKGDGSPKRNREYHYEEKYDEKRKDRYDREIYDEEFRKEKQNEEKRKHKKKNKRFYNWSWKEIKNNFKGSLENFPDVSDMISKYVLFDKKKVEGVLDTVFHYYKKGQEKTQKILESYSIDEKTQNVKNGIWTLMGDMKNKWVDMKNDFLETHFGQTDDKENEETILAESENKEYTDTEATSKIEDQKNTFNYDSRHESESVAHALPREETENVFNEKEWEENAWNMKEVDELLKEAQRRFSQQESNINSWMFERAQHRAELREHDSPEENDDSENNWFLRKHKDSSDNMFGNEKSTEEKYFKGI